MEALSLFKVSDHFLCEYFAIQPQSHRGQLMIYAPLKIRLTHPEINQRRLAACDWTAGVNLLAKSLHGSGYDLDQGFVPSELHSAGIAVHVKHIEDCGQPSDTPSIWMKPLELDFDTCFLACRHGKKELTHSASTDTTGKPSTGVTGRHYCYVTCVFNKVIPAFC